MVKNCFEDAIYTLFYFYKFPLGCFFKNFVKICHVVLCFGVSV
jgi:hypothetical protein